MRTTSAGNRDRLRLSMPMLFRSVALCVVLSFGSLPGAAAATQEAPFHFEVKEGRNLNYFLRDGRTAAHLVLRSGQDPRILVAFPAGNSGVGLWFVHHADRASFRLRGPPVAVHDSDARGRALYGISAQATVEGQELQIRQAVLSSIRVLRDYQL